MLRKLAKKLMGQGPADKPSEGFFLNLRCRACGEEFHLFIHKSTDLMQKFDEQDRVTYALKKEVIGSRCRNLLHVSMEFDESRNLISRSIENGEFIDE